MDVEGESATGDQEGPRPGLSRRDFTKKSAKALYIAPALTLLGSVPALAQFGSPPPPPGGAAPAAPAAPAPGG